MNFEKFKESIPAKPYLRDGIAELMSLFPDGKKTQSSLDDIANKYEEIENKCLYLFEKYRDELAILPSNELKELISKLAINSQGKTLHIINCLTDVQIKELFDTPQNNPAAAGYYTSDSINKYAFTGFLAMHVANISLCSKLYNGFTQLENARPASVVDLVLTKKVLESGIENSLFKLTYTLKALHDYKVAICGAKNIYGDRTEEITDFFENNKKQIQKEYSKEVDTPLAWMDVFLKNRPSQSSVLNREFQQELRIFMEASLLEQAITAINNKSSVMKV